MPVDTVIECSVRKDGRLANDPELAAERFFNLALFDDLPRPLRWAIHEAIVSWDPRPFWRYFATLDYSERSLGLHHAIRSLMEEERRDQLRQAEKYERATGNAFPHLAANATILRYGRRESRGATHGAAVLSTHQEL